MPPLTENDVVTALYRAILLREPDQQGLAAHIASIAHGSSTLEQTIGRFLDSDEFRSLAPGRFPTLGAHDQSRFTNDQTQHGEFGILLREWVNGAALHRILQ